VKDPAELYEPAKKTVAWLEQLVVADARGDALQELETAPSGRFWLGRLAPEESAARASGERGERMEPCACGVRFQPQGPGPWTLKLRAGFRVWTRPDTKSPWSKGAPVVYDGKVTVEADVGTTPVAEAEFANELAKIHAGAYTARLDVEVEDGEDGSIVTVILVNTTAPDEREPNLYECWLEVDAPGRIPFTLDALPDSFRYDRHVDAYGISGGVQTVGDTLRTTDVVTAERTRPTFWDTELGPAPDLRFSTLSHDPFPSLDHLVTAADEWGKRWWSDEALGHAAAESGWDASMLGRARNEAFDYRAEVERLRTGVETLRSDSQLLSAFKWMNEAIEHSSRGRYDGWRPFQVGFQLQALPSLVDPDGDDRLVVDTLWFATGGGKTETYLGLVVIACLLDRLRGKQSGITAWSRFPLRMLSLQQMQRFADALAGAELARRRHDLGGAPFRLGFLVGAAGTPNRIRQDPNDNAEDADDDDMPGRYQRLERCPFCHRRELEMAFNQRHWQLEHRCLNQVCPWPETALPVVVVDEEIFRLLPAVIVGTLDKAASIAWQAAMRGLVASPLSRCSGEGHGYRYAPRSSNADGCLVPGCRYSARPLGQDKRLFAPILRVQDELHLLRDSLGAVDSQYETILDHLQASGGAPPAKVIASSATLAGHAQQVQALYRRAGRTFPLPGPRTGRSFWSLASDDTMRRFVGLGPRGQTLEYAADRIANVLQQNVRRMLSEPETVARDIGIGTDDLADLLDLYGTQVVYGSRLRDVEAAARSFESEVPVTPLEHVTLTGGTPFDEVREALDRLTTPEPRFEDRIHLVAASSMMSHGVDVDRLNVITMLGLPLATAEFIQTTARIGRTHPGLVFVLHRMGGERDASVFRSFSTWVEHGDRFVEPVPITRRSRRVLELAYPGAFTARVFDVHEPAAVARTGKNLMKASRLKQWFKSEEIDEKSEWHAMCDALGIDVNEQPELAEDLNRMVVQTFRALEEPGDLLSNQLCGGLPMTSLRDVEAQAPIVEYDPSTSRRRR
jgi:hypothetical protein